MVTSSPVLTSVSLLEPTSLLFDICMLGLGITQRLGKMLYTEFRVLILWLFLFPIIPNADLPQLFPFSKFGLPLQRLPALFLSLKPSVGWVSLYLV